jgi:hypothetical protein
VGHVVRDEKPLALFDPIGNIFLELPGVDLPRIQYLEGQAEKYLMQVEQEERDRSPIYLAPNISVYTR